MSLQETNEELNDLRRRLEEEQSLIEEIQRQRQEEQRRLKQVQLQLSLSRIQTQPTTLPELLDACHVHLFLGLAIQEGREPSTYAPDDPINKLRPDRIREWKTFPQEQSAIWEALLDADFMAERHFAPLPYLKYSRKNVQSVLSWRRDLRYLEEETLESCLRPVITQLHANPSLQQTFCINGDLAFRNHAGTLADECLASRPRADQFWVYNRGAEEMVPAFIIEHKSPHKLSLAHIKAGLQGMELDQVVHFQEGSLKDICRRVIAAVITQLFSYMIQSGVEYAYVYTGEAFIFLRVPRDDPSTVHYYLSIPKEDVGETTGWTGDLNTDNRLHLTALGQVLAFTLRALRAPPRDIGWRKWAESRLKHWEMAYDDILDEIEAKDIPCSDLTPAPSRKDYSRLSPVRTRSKSALPSATFYNTSHGSSCLDNDGPGAGFYPNSPSRRPREPSPVASPISLSEDVLSASQCSRSKGKSRQYCTQHCLLGLIKGGKLDRKCPNALEHGIDQHQINLKTLLRLLDEQLSDDDLRPDKELGCESLHIHGARGALFKITLWSHGYTFVGKGSPVEFIACANHEEVMYSRLTRLQGSHVPVVLGSLDLRQPFSYDGIAEIFHLMFMSYAGRSLANQHQIDQNQLLEQAGQALQAIHNLGILHCDPMPRNMIWNKETNRVMFIDFERAKVHDLRMSLPLNEECSRQATCECGKCPNKRWDCFASENRRMRNEL